MRESAVLHALNARDQRKVDSANAAAAAAFARAETERLAHDFDGAAQDYVKAWSNATAALEVATR